MWFDACDLQVHLVAMHAEPGFEWKVPGVGALCETPIRDVRVLGGVFRNSISRTSAYAGFTWQPIHIEKVKIGAMGGVITGYGHGIEPLGAIVASRPITEKLEGHVAFIPRIVGKTPMTLQFSVSWRF